MYTFTCIYTICSLFVSFFYYWLNPWTKDIDIGYRLLQIFAKVIVGLRCRSGSTTKKYSAPRASAHKKNDIYTRAQCGLIMIVNNDRTLSTFIRCCVRFMRRSTSGALALYCMVVLEAREPAMTPSSHTNWVREIECERDQSIMETWE